MELNYFVDLCNLLIDNDRARDAGFAEIDRAVSCEFENPPELKQLSWIGERKFPTTAFADAAHAATRSFASRTPTLTVFPAFDDPAEYEQVEQIETAMQWEFERLNRIGQKPVHWRIVESAMKYCAVAIQTEYLPYILKGREKDARIKHILRQAKFAWHVHHPSTVHSMESENGLECVLKACMLTGQELVDKFGRDNKGVKEMLLRLEDDDKATLYSTEYAYFDLTTWEERVQYACEVSNTGMTAATGGFEFRNEKHGLPFIPWVVVDNQDPIMLPALRAGLYDNANVLNTIIFSKAVDMAAHPELWIRTMDGTLRNVHIDNTSPSQPVVTDSTAAITQLRPPQIDPQLAMMSAEAKADIFRSTVAQVLADIDKIGGTATFSTVNAMLEAAITQLNLGQNAAERAETLAMLQMFEWIEHSDIPLIAYRRARSPKGKVPGQELVIKANYTGQDPKIATFDLDFLYLEMKLQSTSITDKQADLNNEVMKVERLGKSRMAAMEQLGEKNFSTDFDLRGEEDLSLAELQAEAKRIMLKPDLEAEAAKMQMEQAALAAQQQGQPPPGQGQPGQGQPVQSQNAQTEQRGQIFSPQQGLDNRAGGGAGAAGAAPGMNREQMTGQTAGGQGMV